MSRIEVITGDELGWRYSHSERVAKLAKCDEPSFTIVGDDKMLSNPPSLIQTWKRMRREAARIARKSMQFIPYGSVPDVPSPPELATAPSAPNAAASYPPPMVPALAEDPVRPFPGARSGSIDIDLRYGVGRCCKREDPCMGTSRPAVCPMISLPPGTNVYFAKVLAHPRQVHEPVDGPQQMIGRNVPILVKLVE